MAVTTRRLPIDPELINTNISDDGRFVLASAPGRNPVLFDLTTDVSTPIATGGDLLGIADLSNDGRFISFVSSSSNLIPQDLNGRSDVFIRDRQTNRVSRVNISNDFFAVRGGVDEAALATPSLSGDGRRVAFASDDAQLVPNNSNQGFDVYSASVPTPGRLYLGALLEASHSPSGFSSPGVLCLNAETGELLDFFTFSASEVVDKLALDTLNDRLYVKQFMSLSVCNGASTLSGAVTPDRTLEFDRVVSFFALDLQRNILYVSSGGGQILSWPKLSRLVSNVMAQPHLVLEPDQPEPAVTVEEVLLDQRRNELYAVVNRNPAAGIRDVVVYAGANQAQGNPTPARRLFGSNPFVGQSNALFSFSRMLLDPSRPSQGGTPNDAALLLVGLSNTTATFFSNGSRTGFLGDVPPDQLVVDTRRLKFYGALIDPLSNQRYVVDNQDHVLIYRQGSNSAIPSRTLTAPEGFRLTGGIALDRTR